PEQREEFIEAVYQLFSVEGVTTLTDLVAVRNRWLSHSKNLDPKVYETIQKMLSTLISATSKPGITSIFRKSKKTEKKLESN
ncbi:MAG: hypothetical protein IJX80_08935, partial [Clostridia bacterium]|nr:hypothetical protein [Clostridia bacterium]